MRRCSAAPLISLAGYQPPTTHRLAVVCEQLAQSCYLRVQWLGIEPTTSRSLGPTRQPLDYQARTCRFFPSDGHDHRQYSFYHPTEGRRLSRPKGGCTPHNYRVTAYGLVVWLRFAIACFGWRFNSKIFPSLWRPGPL